MNWQKVGEVNTLLEVKGVITSLEVKEVRASLEVKRVKEVGASLKKSGSHSFNFPLTSITSSVAITPKGAAR